MFTRVLPTANSSITLIEPNIERDAPLSVAWLADPHGRDTLRLMGVADEHNHASTLELESGRIQHFLDSGDDYWMIQAGEKIVGATWVFRHSIKHIEAPTVAIMIGDVSARGQGIGTLALQAVIDFLRHEGSQTISARHTMENQASAAMLRKLGFLPDGEPYLDEDNGFSWQNLILKNE